LRNYLVGTGSQITAEKTGGDFRFNEEVVFAEEFSENRRRAGGVPVPVRADVVCDAFDGRFLKIPSGFERIFSNLACPRWHGTRI
jgi:hypothetical protein